MTKKVIKKVVTRKFVKKPTQLVSLAAQGVQADASSELVLISDAVLRTMMADPRFLNAVPCLSSGKAAMESVGKRCGRCSRKRNRLIADALQQLRSCVAGLQGEYRTRLKQLLGAKRVRVLLGDGKSHVTF